MTQNYHQEWNLFTHVYSVYAEQILKHAVKHGSVPLKSLPAHEFLFPQTAAQHDPFAEKLLDAVFHSGKYPEETSPYLRTVSMTASDKNNFHGVCILAPEHPQAIAGESVMGMILTQSGIPVVYDPSKVTAVAGTLIGELSDAQIRDLLSLNLLADGVAAQLLCERGFGYAIGLKSASLIPCRDASGNESLQETFHTSFPGVNIPSAGKIPVTIPGRKDGICLLEPADGTTVISSWSNEAQTPAMTAFENTYGGRVVVHGFDYTSFPDLEDFCSMERRTQLQNAVEYLSSDAEADIRFLCDGRLPFPWRYLSSQYDTFLGVLNLSDTAWNTAEFFLRNFISGVQTPFLLQQDGSWKKSEQLQSLDDERDGIHLRYNGVIAPGQSLVIRISK